VGPEAALVSGSLAIIVAVLTAWFTLRTKREEMGVEEIRTVLSGYKEIVGTLQDEIARLQVEIIQMREAMADCERRNAEMESEVAQLRTCVAKLESDSNQ
jgi:uncharacterized protein YlxW (UPF0749 family)